jgi:methylenetetrahydrofolate dehydrogenase (NADP+)/methenyltetrahydrofolate cyclohydrolase
MCFISFYAIEKPAMKKLLAKPVAEQILNEVQNRTKTFIQKCHRAPKLAVVLVGEDPASVIYTRKKGEAALSLGMHHETIRLPATSTPNDVKAVVEGLNRDSNVDGILIQRPLPKGFIEEEVLYWVSPDKDVDAFHPENAGRLFLGLPCFQPCTPAGIMALLKFYEIPIVGKLACVIGRSSIVGKPMEALLLQADATVIHCHSKTPHLSTLTKQADIVVAAAGKMGLIDHSYIRTGAIVIDVGIHRNAEGKVVGDVLFDAVSPIASAITPVPGGVGPMTIAILMRNTVRAAEVREKLNGLS